LRNANEKANTCERNCRYKILALSVVEQRSQWNQRTDIFAYWFKWHQTTFNLPRASGRQPQQGLFRVGEDARSGSCRSSSPQARKLPAFAKISFSAFLSKHTIRDNSHPV